MRWHAHGVLKRSPFEFEQPKSESLIETEQPVFNAEPENKIVYKLEEENLTNNEFFETQEEISQYENEVVDTEFNFELKSNEIKFEQTENSTVEEKTEEITFSTPIHEDTEVESAFDFSSEVDNSEQKPQIVWNLNDEINEAISHFENSENNECTQNDQSSSEPVFTKRIPDEEQRKLSADRIKRVRELGGRMKTPTGISDLEKEPAYKRRQITLESIPHSSENTISKYTLSDEDGTPKLKDDNSFIHDNVD